ncbi:MAG: hypothetical protein PPP58_01965, partial [Natronomonas sp.]
MTRHEDDGHETTAEHNDERSRGCEPDSPEAAAQQAATAGGFAGAVLGARGGPLGAAIGGLVGGSTGYFVGYASAKAKDADIEFDGETHTEETDDGPIEIETGSESSESDH